MTVRSSYACRKAASGGGGGGGSGSGDGSSGGLSGGDVFLLIFFLGGALYVGIGMLYNFKRHNATGMDLVPNIGFWRELPGLMKDGVRFCYLSIKDRCGR